MKNIYIFIKIHIFTHSHFLLLNFLDWNPVQQFWVDSYRVLFLGDHVLCFELRGNAEDVSSIPCLYEPDGLEGAKDVLNFNFGHVRNVADGNIFTLKENIDDRLSPVRAVRE